MSSTISIVIVNYNVKDLLLKCLASIYSNKSYDFEIETFVVDNNSSDGSQSYIKEFYPQVKLIENNFNAGFPHANNQAFKVASGKYIFMLNPDASLTEGALNELYDFMEIRNDVSLVAPQLLNPDHSFQQSVWRYPTVFSVFCEMHYLHFFLSAKNYKDKNFAKPFEADSFSGAALFFRRSLFDDIGMLDETMFWIEDIEFCYRIKRYGGKLIYYPMAKVIHYVGQSARKNYHVSLSNQIFNKIKFFGKHRSFVSKWIIQFLSFYHVFIKMIVFAILSPFNNVYRLKASAYAYTLPKVFNTPSGVK